MGGRGDEADGGAGPAEDGPAAPSFLCDAMLGGLSRWLRGAGYDAAFEHGIDDGELVRRAQETGRLLLSSDAGVFQRRPLRTAAVRGIYVPRGLRPMEQAGFVLRELGHHRRDGKGPRLLPDDGGPRDPCLPSRIRHSSQLTLAGRRPGGAGLALPRRPGHAHVRRARRRAAAA
ncbi:Mut7-C RNAse domain-containing protein [Sorangium sp. So ce1036]|uniref:Mut7-C RNAse domain-containing protein n=1 Tax=Sorangium sp. So ce1036 TaxID=3133328 RepID=UPI003EFC74B9